VGEKDVGTPVIWRFQESRVAVMPQPGECLLYGGDHQSKSAGIRRKPLGSPPARSSATGDRHDERVGASIQS
jgi:hypothetical protein